MRRCIVCTPTVAACICFVSSLYAQELETNELLPRGAEVVVTGALDAFPAANHARLYSPLADLQSTIPKLQSAERRWDPLLESLSIGASMDPRQLLQHLQTPMPAKLDSAELLRATAVTGAVALKPQWDAQLYLP